MTRPGALMIGNFRPSASVARGLDRAGWRVTAGIFAEAAYVHWSRHVAESFPHAPLDTHPEQAERQIAAHLAAHPEIEVILPITEVAARFLSIRRHTMARGRACALPSHDVVTLTSDKPANLALCAELGVPVAPYAIVETRKAIDAAAAELGYPVIVKPADSLIYIHDMKGLFADDAGAIARALPAWPAPHRRLIVQRRVRGVRHVVLFAAHAGRLIAGLDVAIARTTEPEDLGQSCAGRVIDPHPGLVAQTERLIDALRYTGIGSAEYLVDAETGATSFLEINPRFDGVSPIAHGVGLPYAAWAAALALGRPPAPLAEPWGRGVGRRFVWTKGDITKLRKDIKHRRGGWRDHLSLAGVIALDALRAAHTTFHPLDPAPAIGNHLHPILKRWARNPDPAGTGAAPESV